VSDDGDVADVVSVFGHELDIGYWVLRDWQGGVKRKTSSVRMMRCVFIFDV
jgi:hypothetical protein